MNRPKMTQEEFEKILVDALSLDPESDILERVMNGILIELDYEIEKEYARGNRELAQIKRIASHKIFKALDARGFYEVKA